ncbi:MAG: hypothetical protein ACRD1W_21450, partial [Vicinamibacterales bacterium]
MRWVVAALLWATTVVGQAPPGARLREDASAGQAAYFIRSLDNPRERREARADILDSPAFPGSVVKPIALIAALERGLISAQSTHLC